MSLSEDQDFAAQFAADDEPWNQSDWQYEQLIDEFGSWKNVIEHQKQFNQEGNHENHPTRNF